MPTYNYPTEATLNQIAQDKIARLAQNRLIFKYIPMKSDDTSLLMWDQQDNFQGLQAPRGYGGQPQKVSRTGVRRFMLVPGVFGDYEPIDELELTTRAKNGTFNEKADVSDLVMNRQDKILQRRLDRIEYNIWTLIQNGSITLPGVGGMPIYSEAY